MSVGLVIAVGSDVAQTILGSGYAAECDAAMELHVALREPRRRYTQGWASMLEVEASPESWDHYVQWARLNCRGPLGVRSFERNANNRLLALANKAAFQLERLRRHPAYQGNAVKGRDSTHLPAWRVVNSRAHDPAPTRRQAMKGAGYELGELQHGEMVPREVRARGVMFTLWDFTDERDSELH